MPGPFRSYADTVVGVLGGGGDPTLTALLAAADGVDTALAAPALLADALEQWRSATDGLRDRLISYVLAGVPANVLPGFDTDWLKPEGVRLKASVGPLSAQVDAPAVQIVDPRNASSPPIILGPTTPKSVSAHLAAGPIIGDGALNILPDGVNGALSLQLGVIEVAALASLRRIGDDPSFLAVMAAGFTPGIQLGFGFQISRLGGVVGINRTIDQPAISSKLRDGSASEALFPLDAGTGARRALAAIEVMLPPRLGSSVAGPTMRLSWLEIAGEGFCSLDIAVLIELPGPQRIVVVGVARAGIPPVLKLRIDVVGVIDFQRELIAIDASLWPTATTPLTGVPIDDVVLGVDEDANVMWGVELRVDGIDLALSADSSAALEETRRTATRRFTWMPSTTLPDHWHPYRIETRPQPARRVFVQGLVADLSQPPPRKTREPARSELIGGGSGHELDASAVPNQGLRLERRYALARGTDGSAVLWRQRRRLPVLAGPLSHLRFDLLKEQPEE